MARAFGPEGRLHRPSIVRPLLGHPVLRDQSCWFVANDRRPIDIINPGTIGATTASGVTLGSTRFGKAWALDGTNGYLDLGSTNRFISGTTSPFSVMWIEQGGSAAPGMLNLFPSGGSPSTKSFMVLRVSQPALGGASYGTMSFGPWTSGSLVGTTTVPQSTSKACSVIIIVGTGGCYSQTASDYRAFVASSNSDGVNGALIGECTVATSGNDSAAGATQNYFGWDNADSKFLGSVDNLRVWNRALTVPEVYALLKDPYLGCKRERVKPFVISAAAPTSGSTYYMAC